MSSFHQLEVVGRASEKQLQVGEKLNKITGKGLIKWFNPLPAMDSYMRH